jgi:hypothetical protein
LLHERIQLAQLLLQVLVAPAARFHHWDAVSIGMFFSIEAQASKWTDRECRGNLAGIRIFALTLSKPIFAGVHWGTLSEFMLTLHGF